MENLNAKEILEWYVMAGVDETAGEQAFSLEKKTETAPVRQVTANLAHTDAVKTALGICDNISTLEELRQKISDFEGCALKFTASKTVVGDGNENSKIMLIGEAPGADEDRVGLPFVGRAGKLLDKMLSAINLDRTNCYITNVLPWRPPGNRTPTEGEVAVCLPFLRRQIELIKPDVIVLLGGSAANAILDNAEPISRLRGKWLEYKTAKGDVVEVIATFHPAYLLRNSSQKSKVWGDLLRLQKKLIQ